MGILDKEGEGGLGPAPKRVMVLFYLIDTSGSMSGTKIATVNSALEEVMPDLEGISQANDDAEIKVAIMTFSSGFDWVTATGPVSIQDASMLVAGGFEAAGLTDLGSACLELDKKLSQKEFLKSATGAFAPVILLFSDGAPTDNFSDGLNQLKTNNWFKLGIKIAIAIGEDADMGILQQFTSSQESILKANDRKTLKKLIRTVSVRASQFQSHSKNAEQATTSEEDAAKLVEDIREEIADDPEIAQTSNEDWEMF
jgi:uncharacterized protein YegL